MMDFEYKAVGQDEFEEGVVRAESQTEAEAILAKKGLKWLSLEVRERREWWGKREERMGVKEKILFTEQMASMLKAGLPMMEALGAFVDEEKKSGSGVVRQLLGRVQSGVKFSEALGELPGSFSPAYLAVVKSGETSGTLAESLQYLAKQLRRESELVGRVRAAMIYPVVVLVAMVAVLVFISVAVIPKVVEFAQNSGQKLPAYTVMMVAGIKWLTQWWPLVLVAILVAVGVAVWWLRSEQGNRVVSRVLVKLPLVGELVKSFNRARFARLLGGFYQYGVSVVGSFDILEGSLGNYVYQEACGRIKNRLVVGQTLAQALEEEKELFPSIMARLVRGAERTGDLGATLDRLAGYYEEELEVALKNLTVLIEPILVVMLGIGVLGVAMAVVVPVYKVSTSIK